MSDASDGIRDTIIYPLWTAFTVALINPLTTIRNGKYLYMDN